MGVRARQHDEADKAKACALAVSTCIMSAHGHSIVSSVIAGISDGVRYLGGVTGSLSLACAFPQ